MLPFRYAVRNLFRSKSRLLQTIGGSALVVLLVMSAVAINSGMKRVLSASGSPHNVILVGTGSEESIQRSEVPETAAGIAEAAIPGIRESLGVRAVSSSVFPPGSSGSPPSPSATSRTIFESLAVCSLRIRF